MLSTFSSIYIQIFNQFFFLVGFIECILNHTVLYTQALDKADISLIHFISHVSVSLFHIIELFNEGCCESAVTFSCLAVLHVLDVLYLILG